MDARSRARVMSVDRDDDGRVQMAGAEADYESARRDVRRLEDQLDCAREALALAWERLAYLREVDAVTPAGGHDCEARR